MNGLKERGSSKAKNKPNCLCAKREAVAGDVVLVRYYDHVLFRDSLNLSSMRPVVREAVGWLELGGEDFVRLIWERYAEPGTREESKIRSTGLSIRKCDLVEVTKIA